MRFIEGLQDYIREQNRQIKNGGSVLINLYHIHKYKS